MPGPASQPQVALAFTSAWWSFEISQRRVAMAISVVKPSHLHFHTCRLPGPWESPRFSKSPGATWSGQALVRFNGDHSLGAAPTIPTAANGDCAWGRAFSRSSVTSPHVDCILGWVFNRAQFLQGLCCHWLSTAVRLGAGAGVERPQVKTPPSCSSPWGHVP